MRCPSDAGRICTRRLCAHCRDTRSGSEHEATHDTPLGRMWCDACVYEAIACGARDDAETDEVLLDSLRLGTGTGDPSTQRRVGSRRAAAVERLADLRRLRALGAVIAARRAA